MLVLLAGIGAYLYLRRSLPVMSGTETVAGLSAAVDIVRDADAIPHIFAKTKADALFGLGYVHAQDRLWQMEFQRRIGHGRLSEVFGRATLAQDRFLRTVGFGRAARSAWAALPERAKRDVNAYIAGVNAFVSTRHGSALPPEFTLLRFEPEPWRGEDVIVWQKMMAWDLCGNYSFELLRDDLTRAVGRDRMRQLMPLYAAEGLSILSTRDMPMLPRQAPVQVSTGGRDSSPEASAQAPPDAASPSSRGTQAEAVVAALSSGNPQVRDVLLGGTAIEALGSNNWVVDGTLTASGRPLLANDPHLNAHVPSIWYLAHLSAGDFDVIGGTLPGTPAVALGRNRYIAWGATNVAADVEDLYRERLDPTGRFAEFAGRREPVQIVPETIAIKGAAPVTLDVRITRHGPLVSDAINANNLELPPARRGATLEPLAFRWTALDAEDDSTVAFLQLNEARNWAEFTAAMSHFVAPSQNFVYADVAGHIGYYAPGHIPVRASGDGSLPADGWSGAMEWTGWVPFDQLPHAYDPPEHFIVTANHRPAPGEYPYLLGLEWVEPYRGQRITDLITGATSKLTPDDFARMQADALSLHAQALLPVLFSRVHAAEGPDSDALQRLRAWDRKASGDSVAATLFEAWFLRLVPAIAGDELGPLVTASYAGRFTPVTRFLLHTLSTRDNPWCDDVRTPETETCDEMVTRALDDAVSDLTGHLGRNMSDWRWDRVHRAIFPHQGLDAVGLLRPVLSRRRANGGDWSTVNVGAVSVDHPFEQHAVPGYREIVDLSSRNDSRFIDAVGESGHPLSIRYDDFLDDWHDVRHRPMRMERAAAEQGALGTLRLVPQ